MMTSDGGGDGVHTTQKTVRPQQRLTLAVMEDGHQGRQKRRYWVTILWNIYCTYTEWPQEHSRDICPHINI